MTIQKVNVEFDPEYVGTFDEDDLDPLIVNMMCHFMTFLGTNDPLKEPDFTRYLEYYCSEQVTSLSPTLDGSGAPSAGGKWVVGQVTYEDTGG